MCYMAPSIWRMWISSAGNPNSVRAAVVPWMCATKEDGTLFYAPDIKEAHSGTVEYWKRRSLESKHPILRARYALFVFQTLIKITLTRGLGVLSIGATKVVT
jgi:hypothetical protein